MPKLSLPGQKEGSEGEEEVVDVADVTACVTVTEIV
jgi:hypothetical protein